MEANGLTDISHPAEEPVDGIEARRPSRPGDWQNIGVEFSPSKYAIIHYRRQRQNKSDMIRHYPDIPNVGPQSVKLTHKLLGVVVDSALTFKDHVLSVSPNYDVIALETPADGGIDQGKSQSASAAIQVAARPNLGSKSSTAEAVVSLSDSTHHRTCMCSLVHLQP